MNLRSSLLLGSDNGRGRSTYDDGRRRRCRRYDCRSGRCGLFMRDAAGQAEEDQRKEVYRAHGDPF